MDVTKPYKSIGFGVLDVTKPYKFIGFGALDVTKPYKFIGFGAMDFPGPPGPARPQKRTPQNTARLPSGTQTNVGGNLFIIGTL